MTFLNSALKFMRGTHEPSPQTHGGGVALSLTSGSAVQGPPGTGKTRTLLALLEVLSRISGEPRRANAMGPILACADTNAATDNLVEGLVERGINVTRLGQPAKVSFSLRSGKTLKTVRRARVCKVLCHVPCVACLPRILRQLEKAYSLPCL